MSYFTLSTDEGELLFTQPSADGIMYCNGEMCFAEGKLAGAHPFVVGHTPLREAAQGWYLTRMQLIAGYGPDYPFMQKENIDASKEESKVQNEERPKGQERKAQAAPRKRKRRVAMPPVSQQQRKAMAAAAKGKSTLGIPKKVGKEFMKADKGGKLPKRKK